MGLKQYLFDDRGHARRGPLILVVSGLVGMAAAGAAMAGAAAAMSGNPDMQATWVIVTVILMKVPILWFAWWFLSQNRESPGTPVVWDAQETREIMNYVKREALAAVDRPDAAARLGYLRKEAWHIADRSSGPMKGEAVDLALEVDRMFSSTGRRVV